MQRTNILFYISPTICDGIIPDSAYSPQVRIDTFITACNLQSAEWSVNYLFKGEFIVLIKSRSLRSRIIPLILSSSSSLSCEPTERYSEQRACKKLMKRVSEERRNSKVWTKRRKDLRGATAPGSAASSTGKTRRSCASLSSALRFCAMPSLKAASASSAILARPLATRDHPRQTHHSGQGLA